MPAWEYKFITSGKGGFATPALLESFLNQLGQEEWEILEFQSPPDNPLAFSGLARRSTQREWTLADAATAAAKAEADKLRAEFEAKFKGVGAVGGGAAAEEPAEALAAEADDGDRTYRRPRNTEGDLDPDLAEEEGEGDDWDKIAKEDELPTFFEAIQPLMRRNQRGEGLAAGVEHLAKRWNLSVADVVDALKECGFAIPEDENTRPAYLEYDGDLFWVNMNRRGELWINTKEKPRPVFRVVAGRQVAPEEIPAKAEELGERRKMESENAAPPQASEAQAPQDSGQGRGEESASSRDNHRRSLPEGPALLERIRPLMRRERGGAGRSGSIGFLCRALKCRDNELTAALEALGLKLPDGSGEPPMQVDLAGGTWWLYRDQRGGIWINQRQARHDGRRQEPAAPDSAEAGQPAANAGPPALGEPPPLPPGALSSEAPVVPVEPGDEEASSAEAIGPGPGDPTAAVLAASRLLLKPTKTGAVAAETGRLAETVGKSPDDFLSALVGAGLVVPEKSREKPVFVEHAGEIFWLNKNAKGELWLNAKASKFASGSGEERKPRGRRPR